MVVKIQSTFEFNLKSSIVNAKDFEFDKTTIDEFDLHLDKYFDIHQTLGYPLSVFNKNSTLIGHLSSVKFRGAACVCVGGGPGVLCD